jgi:AraC-like DNA-binding protein
MTVLLHQPELHVVAERCRLGVDSGTHEVVNPTPWVELCLVRRGCFRYRGSSGAAVADPLTGLLGGPYEVAETEHPVPGGDQITMVFLAGSLVADLAGGLPDVAGGARASTPHVDLLHRELLAAAGGRANVPRVEELALRIFACFLARHEPARVAHGLPATARARRDLVMDAQAVLTGSPDIGQVRLARTVGCSPHHLSRIFRETTGMTVSGYRLRLRVTQALDRLLEGADDLAAVAADCGFADHAHLTRSLRGSLGATPTALRRRLHAEHLRSSS